MGEGHIEEDVTFGCVPGWTRGTKGSRVRRVDGHVASGKGGEWGTEGGGLGELSVR